MTQRTVSRPASTQSSPSPTVDNLEEMLTLREASNMLKVGRNTMYELVRSGEIPARKVRSEWRIVRRRLLEWMYSGEEAV